MLKAPLAVTHIHLTPDAVGYLNIARNLSSGHGYISTIKLHYLDNAGVTHGALSDCPPMYPLLAGGVLGCGGDVATLALVNTLLACVACGLVFLIGERLFDWRTGVFAGLAAALAPSLFRAGITTMSDPLALVLALSALSLALRKGPRVMTWFVAGVLAGLAILTRYPCAVVGLALAVFAFWGPSGRRNGFACALGLLPAVVLVILAMPSVQGLHYSVESFHSAMWNLGSPIDPWYCLHHPTFVAAAFLRNTVFYTIDLFAGVRGLFLLSMGLVVWLFSTRGTALNREHKLALAVVMLNVAAYAATWSIPPVKGSRFLLLSYCLLLPFCAAGLIYAWDRWNRMGKLAIATACAAIAIVYVWGCATAASFTGGDCQPLPRRTAALVTSSLPPDAVIASNNPWVLSYSTGLPTALLPRNLDQSALTRFVGQYDIGGIVLLGRREDSLTAQTVSASYGKAKRGPGIAVYLTTPERVRRQIEDNPPDRPEAPNDAFSEYHPEEERQRAPVEL